MFQQRVETRSEKRLVSKARYISLLGRKTLLASFGSVAFLIGVIGVLIAVGGLTMMLVQFVRYGQNIPLAGSAHALFWLLLVGGLSLRLGRLGVSVVKEAKQREAVVPLTRHTIDQLPAREMMVRASVEPPSEQEASLMRAAHGIQETPAKQLLRANTAYIPTQDSLIRTDTEPVQAQETVLPRAATQTPERHEEQLLQAAAGRQKG